MPRYRRALKGKRKRRPGARSRTRAPAAVDHCCAGRRLQLERKLCTVLAGFLVRRVYLGQQARIYLGVAVSTEEAPSMLQRVVAKVAHRVSGDGRQVLPDGSPVVKKGSGHLCGDRWILLYGERRAWRLSISLSHHHKVDGRRVPNLWIQGSLAVVWAACAHFS